MNIDTQTARKPKPLYANQNGFLRGPTEPDEINESNLADALEWHRRAQFVIDHKKRVFPDFETMKAENEKPDDLTAVKERLKNLLAEHSADLQRLYAIHAQDYMLEVMDKYLSKEDIPFTDPAAEAKFKDMYSGLFKDTPLQQEWSNDYEMLRYTYMSQLLPLEERRHELEKEQEEARKRRVQMFPLSKEDFAQKPNDIKLRAARFLVADASKQEKMMTEFQWASRQVKPLQDIFKKDEVFAAEIRSMIVAEQSVKDPRKRAS